MKKPYAVLDAGGIVLATYATLSEAKRGGQTLPGARTVVLTNRTATVGRACWQCERSWPVPGAMELDEIMDEIRKEMANSPSECQRCGRSVDELCRQWDGRSWKCDQCVEETQE